MSRGSDCTRVLRTADATSFSIDPRGTSSYLCRLGFKYSTGLAIRTGFSNRMITFTRKINETIQQVKCSQRQILFEVYLKLTQPGDVVVGSTSSSSKQKLVGSVHGRIFKHLAQELQLQYPLKLRLTMTFDAPVNKTVATDYMTFMSDPRDKLWPKAFKFEKELEGDLWNVPSTETFVNYTMTVEFVGCPFVPSTKGLGIVPSYWEEESGLINKMFLKGRFHCDFTLVSGDGKDRVPCHKLFLAAASPFFDRMIKTDMKEATENECKLEGSTKRGIDALLEFVYYKNVEDALGSCVVAYELLDLGHKYDIPWLEEVMKDLLLAKLDEWWDLEVVFELFLQAKLMDGNEKWQRLKEKAKQVLKMKSSELMADSNTFLNDVWEKAPAVAKELTRILAEHDDCD